MGLFLDKLKQILRRKEKDPAYSLSAEWVLKQLERSFEIIPIYDSKEMTGDQVLNIERFRSYIPGSRQIFIQCTKLVGKIEQGVMIERAIELCCADACFRATGIRVKIMVRVY